MQQNSKPGPVHHNFQTSQSLLIKIWVFNFLQWIIYLGESGRCKGPYKFLKTQQNFLLYSGHLLDKTINIFWIVLTRPIRENATTVNVNYWNCSLMVFPFLSVSVKIVEFHCLRLDLRDFSRINSQTDSSIQRIDALAINNKIFEIDIYSNLFYEFYFNVTILQNYLIYCSSKLDILLTKE